MLISRNGPMRPLIPSFAGTAEKADRAGKLRQTPALAAKTKNDRLHREEVSGVICQRRPAGGILVGFSCGVAPSRLRDVKQESVLLGVCVGTNGYISRKVATEVEQSALAGSIDKKHQHLAASP